MQFNSIPPIVRLFIAVVTFAASFSINLVAQVGGQTEIHHQFQGVHSLDHLGHSVAGIGDANGDGFDDIIVGAPDTDPGGRQHAGSAYIYSGATGALLYQYDGVNSWDDFGYSVAGAGDIDGDGHADFIIGADRVMSTVHEAGRAYVFSGFTGLLLYQFDGTNLHDFLGHSVSGAGDVDGDGFDDLIVGAPGASPGGIGGAGSAFVYSGASGAMIHEFHGQVYAGRHGQSVSGAGDVDGDGFADLIVGSWQAYWTGPVGYVDIYSGATGAILQHFQGTSPLDAFGACVAKAGDVNQDGFADVIFSAFTANPGGVDDGGSVFVYAGSTWELLYQFNGAEVNERLGFSVAGGSDLDGDGFVDLVATSEVNATHAGAVSIYSGASGNLLTKFVGSNPGAYFGWSVSSAGDVNADGRNDLIVGSLLGDNGQLLEAGAAYVFDFHPFLVSSQYFIGASAGGTLNLDLDFPTLAAADEFKILISTSGMGPTNYGVDIPLTQDRLVNQTFRGVYPFATYSNLHGTLSASGIASASITLQPALPPGLVGRTFWLAAIANQPGQLPGFSSIAIPIEITP